MFIKKSITHEYILYIRAYSVKVAHRSYEAVARGQYPLCTSGNLVALYFETKI
jgi:hypothetical protein